MRLNHKLTSRSTKMVMEFVLLFGLFMIMSMGMVSIATFLMSIDYDTY